MRNKNSKTRTDEFSNVLNNSKTKPLKIESDRGGEGYNSVFQNFLKSENIHHFSRFTGKWPSLAERVIGTVRNLLTKPVFEKGNADWLSELPSVIKKYKNTFHHSIKLTPLEASLKKNEKLVYFNLKGNRRVRKPKFNLGHLVRTSDIRKVFIEGDCTNYSYEVYTITEVIHNTIPSYWIDYLPERNNQNLLIPTKLTLEENNQVMKKLNLIQL